MVGPVSDGADVQTASRERTGSRLTPCRPLLKWPGGKRSELPLIAPRVPEHSRYFEPFFGGGSVYFDAIDAESHANDLHPDLMEFYRCVKNDDERFFQHLYSIVEDWERAPLVGRDAIYYECRERYNASAPTTVQRAADFFLLRELAYGGMFRVNANGRFNVPFGRAYAKNKNLREKVDHLRSEAVVAKCSASICRLSTSPTSWTASSSAGTTSCSSIRRTTHRSPSTTPSTSPNRTNGAWPRL
ncbi:MAG: DNA adenine methylase [Acidimicrobiaceae bacterium]|nr:DNA adenine methylase [Acidimicrobiaceae bacterium]MXZ99467.1 DNA adenine methylase [Acidimicrobiaceae bacterium]MYE75923.1 DNA adenine methylase [Acidimicrobiaceae bacterium]MYE95930.1 DNA adenine methylase [Acidimicrobiaceae bacterium]MYH42275.1 DNA adenine methylase [Acidimicrobiaceae bacterium]